MDALSWLLLCWIGFAGLVYLLLQASFSAWPQAATCDHAQTVMKALHGTGTTVVSAEPITSTVWINEVIRWIVEHYCGTPDFVQQWLKSMNEAAKKQVEKVSTTHCSEKAVVFEEVYFTAPASPPVLSNIRAEPGPRQHLTVRAQVAFESLILRLTASKIDTDRMITQNFEAHLQHLAAETQVRLAYLCSDLFAMGCFDGRPELLITVSNVHKPYAVVELDVPSQNHVTAQSSGSDPFWDSQFMFQLTRESRELLFEVYDHVSDSSKPVFLGLALISINELQSMSRPLQRFKLQGHPYSDEVISGKIFVEVCPVRRYLDSWFMSTLSGQFAFMNEIELLLSRIINAALIRYINVSKFLTFVYFSLRIGDLAKNALSYSESETSVASDESLYQHSVLVIEIQEKDEKKYYLVSAGLDKLPSVKKLIKKGKKLHVFNEHTFTATKVSSGHFCSVCMKTVRSTFRRQGYRCRDCRMLCHKRCHYKTETHCPSSNIFNLHIPADLSHYGIHETVLRETINYSYSLYRMGAV
ncbi:Protein CBG14248 [Trichuris trichiura]|uniref:Protein CBG14248 n=1 Tax=Trichuris trichiura TaxID=36087 RepID=A0A077YZV8_TRITR|nr:Protein CBG14248 [Trichuris trichiura]